jgi:DNA-binding MarR family transcriptional regulator
MEPLDVKYSFVENLDMVKTAKQTEQDHIDRWLEEIREQLPMIDLRIEGIVDRIGGIQRRIKRMLDETLEEHGLSSGEWHSLGKLSRTPSGRRSAGELAANVELSSAAMTNRLDRMEKAGFVKRIPDEHDRRSVQIELTDKGRKLYERTVEAQAAKEAIVAEALNPKQQDELNDLLRRLMLAFERREAPK